MNYLFVISSIRTGNIGGTQTLVVRLANGLVKAGHAVSVVFCDSPTQELIDLFPGTCRCLTIPDRIKRHFIFPVNCRRWLASHCGDTDICVAVSGVDMHFFSANHVAFSRAPALIVYVVLDTDYNRTCKREVMGMYTHMFTDRYFKCLLPDNCKFFMNDAVRSFHETCLNAHFHDSRIMPIPINNTAPVKAMRRPFRLVSIGRLDTHMKTYNFTVPAILCELRNEGCTIHWDIYGVGNIWLLERIIKDNNVEDLVTLHGHLPYSKMGSALEGATAFLGMGTAALEAAMFGIPSIIAVAYRSVPESYGFLHDVPFGILGEPSSTWIKVRSIKSVIRDIYDANDAKYSELVKLDREAALRYDVNTLIVDFDVYCSDARDYKIVPFPLCWSAFNMLNSFRSRLFSCGPKSNVINQA